MKGLSIASFILGVIGFLFSFVYGLGMLPSVLAVLFGIITLVKKVLLPMAIPGLIMGLLGIIISHKQDLYYENLAYQMSKGNYGDYQNNIVKPIPSIIKLGEGKKIGELLITFDSIRISKTYSDKYETLKSELKYNFAIIKVNGKNIGKERDMTYWSNFSEIPEYNIEVDKGYKYNPIIGFNNITFDLRPEETDSDILIFEILENTKPEKLYVYIKGQRFIVNLIK